MDATDRGDRLDFQDVVNSEAQAGKAVAAWEGTIPGSRRSTSPSKMTPTLPQASLQTAIRTFIAPRLRSDTSRFENEDSFEDSRTEHPVAVTDNKTFVCAEDLAPQGARYAAYDEASTHKHAIFSDFPTDE